MKINEIITEAPMSDYETFGDFSKGASFGGKKGAVDRRLVTHPVQKIKAAKFFENTHYDFRLYPINQTGAGKISETGVVTPEFIHEHFPKYAEHILADTSNSITIVYVGNTGTQAVMMTPWIMAHRFGHAISASTNSNLRKFWNECNGTLVRFVTEIASLIYGKNVNTRAQYYDALTEKMACALFNAIGTQKSSREGLINRPYEFTHELLAQYLQTGDIKLNIPPEKLKYSGGYLFDKNDDVIYRQELVVKLKSDLIDKFDDVLSACNGKIFVM